MALDQCERKEWKNNLIAIEIKQFIQRRENIGDLCSKNEKKLTFSDVYQQWDVERNIIVL